MFVRETISKRKGSADVTYLHLAHNTWDPERKMTQTKILRLPQKRIDMPLLLQGKVAIVTGGSRGIGAAITLALAGPELK